jgi:hypothetical protein
MSKFIPLYCNSTRETIEHRARQIFEQRGCPEGQDLDHWLQAENEHWDACLTDPPPDGSDSERLPAQWDSLG